MTARGVGGHLSISVSTWRLVRWRNVRQPARGVYPIKSLSTCSDHNHLSSLCDKLTSIELGNHGLQHLITDGGQHLKCEVVILN